MSGWYIPFWMLPEIPTSRNIEPGNHGKSGLGKDDKMAGTYKVIVKNGDSKYTYNQKKGTYDFKTIDYVYEAENFGDALREFLDWTDAGQGAYPEDHKNKASLVFVPAKGKK